MIPYVQFITWIFVYKTKSVFCRESINSSMHSLSILAKRTKSSFLSMVSRSSMLWKDLFTQDKFNTQDKKTDVPPGFLLHPAVGWKTLVPKQSCNLLGAVSIEMMFWSFQGPFLHSPSGYSPQQTYNFTNLLIQKLK